VEQNHQGGQDTQRAVAPKKKKMKGYIMLSSERIWVSMGVVRHLASYPVRTKDSFPGGKAAGA
jgi:hypothetical protein